MTRRVRGKRSATTFVGGTTAATSMSCNSDIGRSAGAAKETGGTAGREKCLWWRYFCLLAPSRIPTSQSFADRASRATTAGLRGNPMCVVWKSSMETVEASTTCSDHRDFELPLYGNPIAWVCTAQPSPAFCQLRPMRSGGRRTSFATHDRGAELRVRQSEDQHRPRREVRDH
jgi:hypothetical protein